MQSWCKSFGWTLIVPGKVKIQEIIEEGSRSEIHRGLMTIHFGKKHIQSKCERLSSRLHCTNNSETAHDNLVFVNYHLSKFYYAELAKKKKLTFGIQREFQIVFQIAGGKQEEWATVRALYPLAAVYDPSGPQPQQSFYEEWTGARPERKETNTNFCEINRTRRSGRIHPVTCPNFAKIILSYLILFKTIC